MHSFIPASAPLFLIHSQEPPYVMEKESEMPLTGNARYEGFCVDLLEVVAANVGFKYEIYLVPDEKYGVKEQDGQWNGMVRELVDGVSCSRSLMG